MLVKHGTIKEGDTVVIQSVKQLMPRVDIVDSRHGNKYEGNIGTVISKRDYIMHSAKYKFKDGSTIQLRNMINLIPVQLLDSTECILCSPDFLFKKSAANKKVSPIMKAMLAEIDKVKKKMA